MLPFSIAVEILGVGSADLMFATVPPVMACTVPVTGAVVGAAATAATVFMLGAGWLYDL